MKVRLAKVTWIDAYDGGQMWQSLEDLVVEPFVIESVGWIPSPDELDAPNDLLVAVQNRAIDEDKIFGYFVIPRAWIRSIQYLDGEETHEQERIEERTEESSQEAAPEQKPGSSRWGVPV